MKKLRLIKNKRGMTLVEVVSALCIVALLAVMLVSVFGTAVIVVGREANYKKNNAVAAGGLENAVADTPQTSVPVTEEAGSLTITFGGNVITGSGTYYNSEDPASQDPFRYFQPD